MDLVGFINDTIITTAAASLLSSPATTTATATLAAATDSTTDVTVVTDATAGLWTGTTTVVVPEVGGQRGEGSVSEELLDSFLAAWVLLSPVISAVSVAFCVVNAAVYWQQRQWLLVAVDLGDGLCAALQLMDSVSNIVQPTGAYFSPFARRFLAGYVGSSCRRAALWLNAVACWKRFLAIAFPLKSRGARGLCGQTGPVIAGFFALSIGVHVYKALMYKIVADGAGGWLLVGTDIKADNPDVFAVLDHVTNVAFNYAPLVIILGLNISLLVVLRRHRSQLTGVTRTAGGREREASTRNSASTPDPAAPRNPGLTSSFASIATNDTTTTTSAPPSQDGKEEKTSPEAVTATNTTDNKTRTRKETKTTKMVMLFTTVFVLMAFPRMLNSSLQYLIPEYGPTGEEKNLYQSLSILSSIISHQTEFSLFWVSFLYSRSFRRAVYGLPVARWLCGRWLLAETGTSSTGSSASGAATGSSSLTKK